MSNFGDHPVGFFGVSSEFYDFEIQNSLLFEGTGGLRINSGEANTSYWTLSVWIKRHKLGGNYSTIMSATNYGSTYYTDVIGFGSANTMFSIRGTNSSSFTSNAGTAKVRDTAAWYHYCLRNNNGTVTRWLNGVQDSTYSISGPFTGIGRSGNHDIGAYGGSSESYNNNFSLAEFYFINDSGFDSDDVYDYSQFAEFKNGVLVPKENSLTAAQIGDGGWYYEFKQTGDNADASGVGADSSGNNHHASIIGTIAADNRARPDTPTNNFATLNPSYRLYNTSSSFAQGNLQHISNSTGVTSQGHSTIGLQQDAGGKWYAECRLNVQANGSTWIGVVRDVPKLAGGLFVAATRSNGYAYKIDGNATTTDNNGSSYGNTYTAGDIIGIALDLDNDQIFFYKNGTIQNSGTAAFTSITALSNGTADTSQHFVFGADTDPQNNFTFNFGQDSTFGGTETAGGNADANGIGDFLYTVPTGYLAVCTSNLPEPTIGPNSAENTSDYFNVVGYTGNGGALSVTGFDHQPDLLWIKSRSITGNHRLTDSSRGVSFNWITNADDAEKGDSDSEDIDSFDTDGFTVTQSEYDDFNDGSDTYLAFSWKANGGTDTATGNEDGNNPGYNQQASSKAGFSIIKYVGTQAAGTIPHGLGKKPDWMIFKNRTVNGNAPVVYHSHNTAAPATDHLTLQSSNLSVDNANRFNDTEPTSSVFTLGADGNINDDGVACIAYIWTGIEGFSKFGSYVGNSNSDGVFIYLGFRPAWVMYKGVIGVGNNWHINYPKLVTNENNKYVLANGDGSEGSANAIDFLSNGFKFRHSSQAGNNSSGTYVYMAFAETPFKYANAR